MKNLKKVLALVLVVAMMASFAVSASAASFTDNDKIVYNDAVKLLSTLDVVNGFTDGSFNPEGNVTRAQTAKMIAFIMNGGEDASSSFASAANFSDVANGYWAANSIGYCATKEIVAGAGNNLYYPNNDVTGVQIAKMALVALGYDPTIEKLTGSSWAINTINLAEDAGLFDGMNKDFNASAAASRQEAAQILYNMLLSEMVCYTDNGTNIIVGDITINTDATRKYMNKDGEGVDKKADAELGVEEYFDLAGTGAVQDGTDDYGRPSRVIDVKGVDSITLPDDADLTYEGQVTAGTLYSNLGNDVRDYDQIVYVDGDNVYDESGKETTGDADQAMVIKKNDDTKNGFKGATMEVYIDKDAETVTFVIINTYLAQVDSVDENKDDENLIDIDFDVFDLGTITLDEQESFGYEEDDYLLVTVGKDGSDQVVDVIGAPETIEGTASRISSDYYTIDGTKYNFSEQYNEDAVGTDNTGTYTFYLDKQGNIIGSTEIEAGASAGRYLFVDAIKVENDGRGFDYYVQARVTFTDGTEATIDLPTRERNGEYQFKDVNGEWEEIDDDNLSNYALKAEEWYSYTSSGSEYTLKEITSDYVSTATVKISSLLSGSASVGNSKTATSSTKLYLVESDLVYTGYRNFPDPEDLDAYANDDSTVPVLYILSSRNGKTASEIYVMNDGGTSESVDIAMYAGEYYTSDDDYAYFYADGTEDGTAFKMDTNVASLVEDQIYALDGNATDGYTATVITEENFDGYDYKIVVGKVSSTSDTNFTLDEIGSKSYTDKANETNLITKETDFYDIEDFDDDQTLAVYSAEDGTAESLSKNDIVKVVYIEVDDVYYAFAAYIMD